MVLIRPIETAGTKDVVSFKWKLPRDYRGPNIITRDTAYPNTTHDVRNHYKLARVLVTMGSKPL